MLADPLCTKLRIPVCSFRCTGTPKKEGREGSSDPTYGIIFEGASETQLFLGAYIYTYISLYIYIYISSCFKGLNCWISCVFVFPPFDSNMTFLLKDVFGFQNRWAVHFLWVLVMLTFYNIAKLTSFHMTFGCANFLERNARSFSWHRTLPGARRAAKCYSYTMPEGLEGTACVVRK